MSRARDFADFPSEISVDTSGRVTMSNQPAFLVHPSSTLANVAADANQQIPFQTEVYDQGSNFSSNTFTAPITGRYLLCTTIYGQELDGGIVYMELSIDTSNRSYTTIQEPSGSESVYAGGSVVCIADMDANDTANVRVTVGGSSSTFDVIAATRFSGALIC